MTDMCVQGPLPEKVSAAIAPWTCLEHASCVEDYQQVLLETGLRALCYQDESHHLLSMLSMLKRNLLAAGMGQMAGYLGEQAASGAPLIATPALGDDAGLIGALHLARQTSTS